MNTLSAPIASHERLRPFSLNQALPIWQSEPWVANPADVPDWLSIPAPEAAPTGHPHSALCLVFPESLALQAVPQPEEQQHLCLISKHPAWALHTDPDGRTLGKHPLDKHQLDVALSRGRQRIERARLTGIRALQLATSECLRMESSDLNNALSHELTQMAAYQLLMRHGSVNLAAVVGAAIAAAQLCMSARITGPDAWTIQQLSLAMNPDAEPWLRIPGNPNHIRPSRR